MTETDQLIERSRKVGRSMIDICENGGPEGIKSWARRMHIIRNPLEITKTDSLVNIHNNQYGQIDICEYNVGDIEANICTLDYSKKDRVILVKEIASLVDQNDNTSILKALSQIGIALYHFDYELKEQSSAYTDFLVVEDIKNIHTAHSLMRYGMILNSYAGKNQSIIFNPRNINKNSSFDFENIDSEYLKEKLKSHLITLKERAYLTRIYNNLEMPIIVHNMSVIASISDMNPLKIIKENNRIEKDYPEIAKGFRE